MPTHTKGHILDHVVSRECDKVSVSGIDASEFVSDHSLVTCKIGLQRPTPKTRTVSSRKLQNINLDDFKNDIRNSMLADEYMSLDLTSIVDRYNSELRSILDKHAPVVQSVKKTLDSVGTVIKYRRRVVSHANMNVRFAKIGLVKMKRVFVNIVINTNTC